MQNRAQIKESKCAKDILKCANEEPILTYVHVIIDHKRYYMSAYVLLNLFNKLRKRDKM